MEIEVPDEDLLGPHMLALNPRQRRFVCALGIFGGDQKKAYAAAGYTTNTAGALQASASRAANSEPIKRAIHEEAWRRMHGGSLLAASVLVELMMSNDEAIRLKAALALQDRTGFHAKSEHHVVVDDHRTEKDLVEFIVAKARLNGLDPRQLLGQNAPDIIDAEFAELKPAIPAEAVPVPAERNKFGAENHMQPRDFTDMSPAGLEDLL